MIRRLIIRLLLSLGALLGVMVLAASWLWFSQPGSRWLIGQAAARFAPEASWQSIEGSLGGELQIAGLDYALPQARVRAAEVRLAIHPRLMPLNVRIEPVDLRGLTVDLKDGETAATEPGESAAAMPDFLEIPLITVDDLAVRSAADEVLARATGVQIRGRPEQWTLSGAIEPWFDGERLGIVTTESSGDLSSAKIDIRSDSVLDGSADANLAIDWAETLTLSATARGNGLSPAPWVPDWPAGRVVDGSMSLDYDGGDADGRLRVSEFEWSLRGTPSRIQGSADINLAEESLQARVDWSELSWPPAAADPLMSSPKGQMQLQGRPNDWSAEGSLSTWFPGYPPAEIELRATGNREAADLALHRAAVLGGVVEGTARTEWTNERMVEATLSFSGIDTAALLPDWPAVVNGRLSLHSDLEADHRLDLTHLDGRLLDQPLQAQGQVSLQGEQPHFSEFSARWGGHQLALDGSLDGKDGLRVDARSSALNDIDPAMHGQVFVDGRLGENQELSFGWTGENESLSGRWLGTLTSSGPPAQWSWAGELQALEVDPGPDALLLSLQSPALLELARSRLLLDGACLASAEQSSACVTVDWSEPEKGISGLRLSGKLKRAPLSLVHHFTDSPLVLSQVLSGEFKVQPRPGGLPEGRARLELSPGTIHLATEPQSRLRTGPGVFAFDLAGGRITGGQAGLDFPGNGRFEAEFSASDLDSGLDSPLTGRINIDVDSLSGLPALISAIDQSDGSMEGEFDISGTLGIPQLGGNLSLSNGGFRLASTGLSLEGLNLEGQLYEDRRAEFRGTFEAGEEQGLVFAAADFRELQAPHFEIGVEGQNLTLVDTPDLTLLASPNVRAEWRDDRLRLDGEVLIPSARIAPRTLPATAVEESPDLVIVAGAPENQAPEAVSRQLAIEGSLAVTLGENVLIDLDLARARLQGTATFDWRGDLIPTANGAYQMSGGIQAFGQQLRIEEGRIGFPNVPASDPHLNIRAEREIFGNTAIRRAGIFVNGTLRRPAWEAYTVPMTNKHRAQTLLVTGSDFNYERGQGAVDVGMYIAPRLYLGYGIGLFEEENVVTVRYDLRRGFGIRATSGQKTSGLDASYTIER